MIRVLNTPVIGLANFISYHRLFEEILRQTGEIKPYEMVSAINLGIDGITYKVERKNEGR